MVRKIHPLESLTFNRIKSLLVRLKKTVGAHQQRMTINEKDKLNTIELYFVILDVFWLHDLKLTYINIVRSSWPAVNLIKFKYQGALC